MRPTSKNEILWAAYCGVWSLVAYAAWNVCLYRAFQFLLYARDTSQIQKTMNAYEDYEFSIDILGCYGFDMLVIARSIWLLLYKRAFLSTLPVLLCLFAACYLIDRNPEQVIHLFPSFSPYISVAVCLISGFLGIVLAAIPDRNLWARVED
jgi:hypothetical protein